MSVFWDRFYELSTEKDGSPNATAKKLNIPSGSVTAWKGGSVPRLKTIFKLAEHFSVPADYLLGRTDSKNISYIENDKIVFKKPKLTENELNIRDEFEQRELYLASKRLVELVEQKEKSPTNIVGEANDEYWKVLLDSMTPEQLAEVIFRASQKLKGGDGK